MLVLGFLYSKNTPIVKKKKKKNDTKKPTCQVVLPLPKLEANMN